MYVFFVCFILSIFPIVCLSVTVKWLAVKTVSEMTYTVSGGELNSTQSNPVRLFGTRRLIEVLRYVRMYHGWGTVMHTASQ